MAFWLALAGIAVQAVGKEQAAAATVEGAQTQAEIEALSRSAIEKRFQRDIKYQEPFFEAGKRAVVPYDKAIKGEFDVTNSPLYKMQESMINDELQDAPDFVRENALEGLKAREGEMVKSRLLDLQKIGLGAAATAGTANVNLGSAFASSISRGQGALAQGTLSGDMQRQNMWTSTLQDLSGYPAYAERNKYIREAKAKGTWNP